LSNWSKIAFTMTKCVGHLLILKISDHSFVEWKISDLEIAHFLLIFSLLLFLKERSLFLSFFWKEGLCGQSHNCSFQKSNTMSKCSFTLLLFFKEWLSQPLHICSFLKSDWASDRTIPLLKRANICDEWLSKWVTTQP